MINPRKHRKEAASIDNSASGYMSALAVSASSNTKSSRSTGGTWYEAMAQAWGDAMDKQATVITDLSNQINSGGNDTPSFMVQLTAESQKMGFMATSASTSNNSVGEALQTLAKKQ